MKRLDAIKERLAKVTDLDTDTDEKLENSAISDWVNYADADMAWLLRRMDELLTAGQKVLDGLNARIDMASAEGVPVPVFDGIADLHTAIHRTVDAGEGSVSMSEAVRIARGGDPSVKRHGFA